MTTNVSRAPIDFAAFERDLHQGSSSHPVSAPKTNSDPLAELARIVGQDDPFRALLEARGVQAAPAAVGGRLEPSFYESYPDARDQVPAAPTPADAFDQYLASVEQSHQVHEEYPDPAAFESDDRAYANAATLRPHKRGKLVQVGAGLGVLVFCLTGAFAWKGLHSGGSNGEPVTVLADRSPLKVAPEKADGVVIPDQNKQIYERNAKDGQIKVVNREEQPLDVAQAARSASSQGGVTPGSTGMLTESLGEPRRIRTVAVKPDTPPPAMPQREASAETGAAPVSPIPTMMMPDGSSNGAPAQATERPHPSRTLASTTVPTKPAPARVEVADASATVQPVAAPVATPRKAPQRVASVAPEETVPAIAPEATTTASTSSAASVGGFSVQIGVRSSEADARAALRQMQAKYSQLSGKPELIRQAEVNGASIYRVRVGPLAKAEATTLCTSLKGAGGQCFVAKN